MVNCIANENDGKIDLEMTKDALECLCTISNLPELMKLSCLNQALDTVVKVVSCRVLKHLERLPCSLNQSNKNKSPINNVKFTLMIFEHTVWFLCNVLNSSGDAKVFLKILYF